MINDNIKIEIEMRDTKALFAVKKMIGYTILDRDNYKVDLQMASGVNERNSLIFTTNLEGFEDVSRIVEGIHELKLGKQQDED